MHTCISINIYRMPYSCTALESSLNYLSNHLLTILKHLLLRSPTPAPLPSIFQHWFIVNNYRRVSHKTSWSLMPTPRREDTNPLCHQRILWSLPHPPVPSKPLWTNTSLKHVLWVEPWAFNSLSEFIQLGRASITTPRRDAPPLGAARSILSHESNGSCLPSASSSSRG